MATRTAAPTTPARPAPIRRGIPFIGGTLAYIADPLGFMRQHYDRYGPVSQMGFIGDRWTILLGPDATNEALRNPEKAFASEPGWGRLVGPFFKRGLMLLDFEEHHLHRRLLQEAFTRPRLEGYVDAMGPAVAASLDAWTTRPDFPAYPELKSLTLHLATEIFMGGAELAGPREFEKANRAFIDCVQAATAIIRLPIRGTRWGNALAGRKYLESFLTPYVESRRSSSGTDIFSVLCQVEVDGDRLSAEDVVNHMIFLLMAAHDTSTITVSTAMRYLGQHPDWQRRLRDSAAHLPDSPTLADLESLRDFDLVIRECLRLLPPVPVLARRTVKETTVLGVRVPANQYVAVMPHLQHHMEEYWTEPERFDPERFNAERQEDRRHRHAWEPFGGGVHKCLGMFFAQAEVKLILHQILRRFEWSVPADYETPLNYQSLPYPSDGQPVALRNLTRRTR